MITKRKQRIVNGIQNNILAKATGYPTASIFSDFEVNTEYRIDFLKHTIFPKLKEESKLLLSFFEWFDKEVLDRRVDVREINECFLIVNIEKSKFLFFGYRTYNFKTYIQTKLNERIKTQRVKGWL